MGNPQETVSLFNLGWLAGFIDGEGAIGISIRNRKNEKGKYFTPKPHLQICNTEYKLIEKCMYIYDALDVPYHISYYPSPKGNRQSYWTITVAGQQRVMKLLQKITPLLQSIKRKKAELVMDFCYSREDRKKGDGYSSHEMNLIDKLLEMNKRGKTDRQDPQRLHARPLDKGDDIVQTTTTEC